MIDGSKIVICDTLFKNLQMPDPIFGSLQKEAELHFIRVDFFNVSTSAALIARETDKSH